MCLINKLTNFIDGKIKVESPYCHDYSKLCNYTFVATLDVVITTNDMCSDIVFERNSERALLKIDAPNSTVYADENGFYEEEPTDLVSTEFGDDATQLLELQQLLNAAVDITMVQHGYLPNEIDEFCVNYVQNKLSNIESLSKLNS